MTHGPEDKPRIGLIGLGLMGHGIGRNLLKHGFALKVLGHVNRKPVESLVGLGATEGASLAALVDGVDVIMLCVTGSAQIEDMMYRQDGILAHIRPGQTVIDCSTSDPVSSEKINAEIVARGALFIDAPLGRTPVEAEEGRLNTMVGATPETLDAIRPILSAYCENIVHTGEVLSAQKLKLINNFVVVGAAGLLAEATKAAQAQNVDIGVLYGLMSKGPLAGGLLDMVLGQIVKGHHDGMKFTLGNAAKDIGYFNAMIASAPPVGPLSGAVAATLEKALEEGRGDQFLPSLAKTREA